MKDELKISKMNPLLVNNEKVFLSTKITKYNDMGYRQERKFVLTNNAIYNIKKSKVQRRIPYENLEALSVSILSSEFVLHVKNSYDYRMLSFEKRNDIIESILKIMCMIRKICSVFHIYFVPMINLNRVMTTHALNNKKKVIRPSQTYLKVMNLEKYITQEKQEENRRTELRKKTTMLFVNQKKSKEICFDDFELLKVLGKGAFGKVILVMKKDNKKIYAIKILNKQQIIDLDQLEHTLAEKIVLQHVNHPFLVGLEYAFQTPEKLYFVMEFMRGGELFQHLRNQKRFSEKQAKFYAACVILGIGHLHNKNYIYRDLKLENLLLDVDGYVKLTDFGLAKFIKKEDVALTFCGTPDYLAPEVILGKGHNRAADWWSLGILLYEMIFGIPPFYSSQVQKMYRKIVREKVVFRSSVKVSDEAKDIILKLLNKDQKRRLGSISDSLEILSHPFFNDLHWKDLISKNKKAPFIPEIKGDKWIKNFDEDFTKLEAKDSVVKVDLEKLKEFQKEFEEFNYNKDLEGSNDN